VLGEVAVRALARRQFYVGNTRYRGAHAIDVSHKDEILRRLMRTDGGRDLATEFIGRGNLSEGEQEQMRRSRSERTRMHAIWRKLGEQWQQIRESRGERAGV